jgi:glycosyltransferase involved in cell wall biosynthesis
MINALSMACRLAGKFDVIHSNTYTPTFAAEVASRLKRRPHLMTIHDVYNQTDKDFWRKWTTQQDIGTMAKYAGALVERMVLKLPSTMVHTVSQTSKRDLIAAGIAPEKIALIPNGIDPAQYRSDRPKKRFQLAYIGRLVFYKNVDTVIKAFKAVCGRIPAARFFIAGTGPHEEYLKGLTSTLGLNANVSFLGKITDQQKVDLLTESQFTVQPSLVEGFGITVIESFCCATPVISSNVMPLPELVMVHKTGTTLDPFDIDAWEEALLTYLNDPDRCIKEGLSSKQIVKTKYTIEGVVDRLSELYSSLCHTKHGNLSLKNRE